MKVKFHVKVLVLALSLAAVGFVANAQRGGRGEFGPPGGGGPGRLFASLNLTQAQQTQIDQIAERYRQNFAPPAAENNSDPLEAAENGTFDEAAVRAAAQARADKFVEMEVARARMFSEMYAVLTAEQKSRLAELRKQMAERRQQRGPGAPDGMMPPPPQR